VIYIVLEKNSCSFFLLEVEEGGSRFPWNTGNHLPDYMVTQPRRSQSYPGKHELRKYFKAY
jgi:hypothetical protein